MIKLGFEENKHNLKKIKETIDVLSKEYDDDILISCYYCDNCKEYINIAKRMDFINAKDLNCPKCPKCGNNNLEYILSNSEIDYSNIS